MGDPPTEWLPPATLQAVLLGLMHSQPSEPRRSWIDCGLSVIGAMQNASPAGVDVDVGAGVGEGQMKVLGGASKATRRRTDQSSSESEASDSDNDCTPITSRRSEGSEETINVSGVVPSVVTDPVRPGQSVSDGQELAIDEVAIRNRAGGNARKLNKAFENVLSTDRATTALTITTSPPVLLTTSRAVQGAGRPLRSMPQNCQMIPSTILSSAVCLKLS
ncbi:hypothetical protein B0H13DRAFT_2661955 [Mycena leptocephala]|nr:hypothetical protein B0H13DRAFT_2661955 [Mycena leptocephala]